MPFDYSGLGPTPKEVRIVDAPCPARELSAYLQVIVSDYQSRLEPGKNFRAIFGEFYLTGFAALGSDFMLLYVARIDGGAKTEILAHVSQIVLRFEVFSPKTDAERNEKIEEKVLRGFAPEEAPPNPVSAGKSSLRPVAV